MTLRSKRGVVLVCVVLGLVLFLVRPGAARLKTRIATSIGMALQRQVEIGRVHIRLLPRPGFDLENFVVHDDPSFGAEPVLRAQDVAAYLRLSSLFRGHLEIARLSLTEPSLNVVRRDDGRWNIENFLERTATITRAVAKNSSESHPAMPYIEADRGRINFKIGREKKPFAITDADYAFWQESQNTWGMRVRGQPVRTDFNVTDTGQLRMSGSWAGADVLSQTPVRFNLQWEGAQLGQFSKLLSGRDKGWRGAMTVSLGATGTPADLHVIAEASLLDFRRYDIPESARLELKTHCDARYQVADHSLHEILCQSPVGDGQLSLRGTITNVSAPTHYEARLHAVSVPLDALLSLLRRAKKNLPDDLQADGTVDGQFKLNVEGASVSIEGRGQTTEFHLRTQTAKNDLTFDAIPFSVISGSQAKLAKRSRLAGAHAPEGIEPFPPEQTRLDVGPFQVKLGRPAPASVQGWVARSGYGFSLKGDADLQRLVSLARATGLPAAQPAATGSARLDLEIAGVWSGFPGPEITGKAELHQVRAEFRGLTAPVEIALAKLSLNDRQTHVEALSASAAGTEWKGTLDLPRGCPGSESCRAIFDLHADVISTDLIHEWLVSRSSKKPWYEFPTSAGLSGSPLLATIRASGTLTADHILIRDLSADHCTTRVELEQGRLRLADLRADVLGGEHRGEWRADFNVKPPAYSGTGTLEGISLSHLADVMHENWISGTADARYELSFSGLSASDVADSAKGTLEFDARDGILPHFTLASTPLRIRRFTGALYLAQGEFTLRDAKLQSPAANYLMTGSASMAQHLDLKLVQKGSPAFTITGTLADPRIAAVRHAETQAALKP